MEPLGFVTGVRTDCRTGQKREVKVGWYIRRPKEGYLAGSTWLHLVGGPTGYESFEITEENTRMLSDSGWNACAGTKNTWDSLGISAEEMRKVFSVLYANSLSTKSTEEQ